MLLNDCRLQGITDFVPDTSAVLPSTEERLTIRRGFRRRHRIGLKVT